MNGTRPNFLYIISDDTDFRWLGCYGGASLTPNIDRIAAGGVIFKNAYCASSVCTPSRYNYLTGQYAGRCTDPIFLNDNTPGQPHRVTFAERIHTGTPSIARLLKSAGYRTGYTGKWHTGGARDHLLMPDLPQNADPNDPAVDAKIREYQRLICEDVQHQAGFDYAGGIVWGNADGDVLIQRLARHNPEWTTQAALDFLDTQPQDQPFCLMMASTMLHGPGHQESLADDPYLSHGGKLDSLPDIKPPRDTVIPCLEHMGLPVDHHHIGITWLDDQIGVLLNKLDEMGIAENTVVVYCGDHNTEAGKATCYQKGVNIPFMVRWPGITPEATQCDHLVQNVDLLATFADLAHIDIPADYATDGTSIAPLLRGEDTPVHADLYFEIGYSRAVHAGKWKYVAVRYPDEVVAGMETGTLDEAPNHWNTTTQQHSVIAMHNFPAYFDVDQLYDLEADPHEQHNLAGDNDYAQTLADMKARLARYTSTFDTPFPADAPDFFDSDRYAELAALTRARHSPETIFWYVPAIHNRV